MTDLVLNVLYHLDSGKTAVVIVGFPIKFVGISPAVFLKQAAVSHTLDGARFLVKFRIETKCITGQARYLKLA